MLGLLCSPPAATSTLDALAQQRRLEAIASIEGTLSHVRAEVRAEPLFRLGGLYLEEAAVQSPASRAGWLQKAARALSLVVSRYPEYERADEAAYLLAGVLRQLDRDDDVIAVLEELLRTRPNSRWAPGACVLLGDAFAARGDIGNAKAVYHGCTDRHDAEAGSRAWHGLARIDRTIGDTAGADDAFRAAAASAVRVLPGQPRLMADVLREHADMLDEAGRAAEVPEHLAGLLRQAEPLEATAQRALVAVLLSEGWIEVGEPAARALLEGDPLAEDAPALHLQLVSALCRAGRLHDAQAEHALMVTQYGAGSRWARRNHRASGHAVQDIAAAQALVDVP